MKSFFTPADYLLVLRQNAQPLLAALILIGLIVGSIVAVLFFTTPLPGH